MSDNVLEKIIKKKSKEIESLKKTKSLELLNELIDKNNTYINFKNKILNKPVYFTWICVWLLIIFVSIRPKYIDDYFVNIFKIDIFYLFSVLGILSLIILNYFFLIKIRTLEKKINTLIRAESLKKILNKIKKY